VRLVRGPGGLVEPDPLRRRGGRGAYLCRSESCLKEAVRRGRWTQAFRAPATLTPEVSEGVRALLEGRIGRELASQGCDDGIHAVARGGGRSGASVEGGW
jgi:predicted RNA-binding protein YlxR (DUF448 family)